MSYGITQHTTLPTPHSASLPKQELLPPAAHNAFSVVSATALVAAPVLLLVPPRKLDLYTLSLCTFWLASAEHQFRVRSGVGILQWMAERRQHTGGKDDKGSHQRLSGEGIPYLGNLSSARADYRIPSQDPRLFKVPFPEFMDPWARRGAALGFDGQRAMHQYASDIPLALAEKSNSNSEAHNGTKQSQEVIEAESIGDRILGQIWAVWNQAHLEAEARPSKTMGRETGS